MIGAIEAGGTKFVCAVSEDSEIIDKISIPTTYPEETLKRVNDFFEPYQAKLSGVGVGSFGPIDLNKHSDTFGCILSTPKQNWVNYDLLSGLRTFINIPIHLTTDVNAACYGEFLKGVGIDNDSLVYITVGTGIGAGGIFDGEFIGGVGHPEMGHMMVLQNSKDDFNGSCKYHDNCLEGLASGTAIFNRLGIRAENLPEKHPFWDVEADYLAQCVYNITLVSNPERVILGGGVMNQKHLLLKVRDRFEKRMNEYLPKDSCYIVLPKLGNDAGIIGCLGLVRNGICLV